MTSALRQPGRVCAAPARVVRNTLLCREHVEIELTYTDLPPSQPGQFLELRCSPAEAPAAQIIAWPDDRAPRLQGLCFPERTAFLNRPFSIADRWVGNDGLPHFTVISRTIGPGTAFLEHLQPGETLDVSGPLGVGFTIPADDVPLLLVGGGVGIPPLLYLSRRLQELGRKNVVLILGVRSRDLLPLRLTAEPDRRGHAIPCCVLPAGAAFPCAVATDDGSLGVRGLVTDAIAAWHAEHATAAGAAVVMACGPERMLRAVAQQSRTLGMQAQLCVERNMGCGLGTCLSCIVRVREPANPAGWRWALSCTEGPVFERERLIDYT